MNLPEILSIGTALSFGVFSVLLSLREEKTKKELAKERTGQKQKLYHIEILKQIQDRIGYSLDIERVIDVIIGSLEDLFPYTSTSSLVRKDGKIIFKAYLKETANADFIAQVKKSMLASLSALLKEDIQFPDQEFITGRPLDPNNAVMPRSFFHIPFVVNGQIKGLITVASSKRAIYQTNDMTMLYQITSQASDMLSRLENVLAAEQEKLLAMIKSLVDGVFMVDVTGKLPVINNSARSILELRIETPTLIDALSSLPKEIGLAELINRAFLNNQSLEKKDVSLRDRILDIFIIPVCSSNRVLGATIIMHDKTLEKNLAQTKEDFTNMVIHELKAPIVAIRGASQLIEDPARLTREEVTKLSILISGQSAKLLSEISSILDAAKIENGKFTLNKKMTDLSALITGETQLFQPEAARRKIKLLVQTEPMPPISIDDQRINWVINNLISNSLKFTNTDKTIIVSAKLNKDEVWVSVTDQGVGIPLDRQKTLFSKYAYSEKPLSTSHHIQNGTGLGLYITKGIIEAHGGKIYLESEVNRGTTVSFSLPIS